jgi:hypothetical protein
LKDQRKEHGVWLATKQFLDDATRSSEDPRHHLSHDFANDSRMVSGGDHYVCQHRNGWLGSCIDRLCESEARI